jgi:hypothetical protein
LPQSRGSGLAGCVGPPQVRQLAGNVLVRPKGHHLV